MRTIYSHHKHSRRSAITLVVGSIFFGAFTAISAIGLVSGIGVVVMAKARAGFFIFSIAGVLTALGAWALFRLIRFHARTPIDVSIAGNELVQFRMQRGEETIRPDALTLVVYTCGGSLNDHLRVRTDAQSWFLPTDETEAEDLIRTLKALNPNITIKRREESTE